MASVASQLIEEVTAHAQSASLEDAREICADGTYFTNNLRNTTYGSNIQFCVTSVTGILIQFYHYQSGSMSRV